MSDDWSLWVRNSDGDTVAILEDYQQATFIPRHNDVGTFHIDGIPATLARTAGLFDDQAGIELRYQGTLVLSGPFTSVQRTFDADTDDATVAGVDDMVWLARRFVYPDPANPVDAQAEDYDIRTGPISTLMLAYVSVNAGPTALTDRRILTAATDPVLGAVQTVTPIRFEPLIDLLKRLALSDPSIGFRVRDLNFEVFATTDRTGDIVFSVELANLVAYSYTNAAPGMNHAIVGGAGELALRSMEELSDGPSVSDYGRIEGFVDKGNTGASAELLAAGAAELARSASRTAASFTAADVDGRRFLDDYQLGDQVTVMVDGERFDSVFAQAEITLAADGVTIRPAIGDPGLLKPLALYDRVDSLERRLRPLEAR